MKRHRNSLRTGPPVHCCSLCKAATPWRPAWKGPNQHLPCLRFQILPQIVSNQKFFRSRRLTETLPQISLVCCRRSFSKDVQVQTREHRIISLSRKQTNNCTYPGLYPYPMLSQSSPFYISQDSSTLPFSPSALNSRKGWLCQELWSPKVKVPVHHETQREARDHSGSLTPCNVQHASDSGTATTCKFPVEGQCMAQP